MHHWIHLVVRCHLLAHHFHLSLHPHCQSLHLHCLSLHLCCLGHHLPGIQYQPHCCSLSQGPGLTLSGSPVSRCWLQNSIEMHFTGAAERGSWTWNGTEMKSTLGSGALLELLSSIPLPQASPLSFHISGWETMPSLLREEVSPPSSCQVW